MIDYEAPPTHFDEHFMAHDIYYFSLFSFFESNAGHFRSFLTIFTFEKALENGEGLILKVIGQVDGQLIAIEKFHCHDP